MQQFHPNHRILIQLPCRKEYLAKPGGDFSEVVSSITPRSSDLQWRVWEAENRIVPDSVFLSVDKASELLTESDCGITRPLFV